MAGLVRRIQSVLSPKARVQRTAKCQQSSRASNLWNLPTGSIRAEGLGGDELHL